MLKKLILWLTAGLLLLILFLQIDLYELHYSLIQIDWAVIGALLSLQIVTQLLLNRQWQRIANFAGIKLSFGRMLYINAQGSIMEAITPGVKVGGEITRAVQIARFSSCSRSQAAVVTALQKLFSLTAFVLINLAAAVYLSRQSTILDNSLVRLAVYTALGLLLTVFLLILIMSHKKPPSHPWLGAVRRFFTNLLEQIHLFENNKKELAIQFALALLIWLLYPIKLYLLVCQFQADPPLIYIASITFIAYLIGMLPLFPGGLGGFEGTMSSLLTGIGLPLGSSAAITVIFRFITFWFVIILSLVYTAVYRIIPKQIPNRERMLSDES